MFDDFGSQYLKTVLNEVEILILRLDILCITLHPTGRVYRQKPISLRSENI